MQKSEIALQTPAAMRAIGVFSLLANRTFSRERHSPVADVQRSHALFSD
ncbi:hypothetical protein B4113_3459 [Geobacillus sp. B4113_201601]|nr:hypothetical protein B4113_3459 [Geobacillus sp. B4113_201601]